MPGEMSMDFMWGRKGRMLKHGLIIYRATSEGGCGGCPCRPGDLDWGKREGDVRGRKRSKSMGQGGHDRIRDEKVPRRAWRG